jgi:26S proteasome regulatory subunit T5
MTEAAKTTAASSSDAAAANSIWGDDDQQASEIDQQLSEWDEQQIQTRVRMMENNIRVLKSEYNRLGHEKTSREAAVKEGLEKVKMNKQLPYLISNIVEVLDLDPLDPDEEEDGAATDLQSQKVDKTVVIKTSTRQTIFLPVPGLVDAKDLKPGDLVGVNKDSFLILDTLPPEYDQRVKVSF